MSLTCGFPCNCHCLTGWVESAVVALNVGEPELVTYFPGSCANSPFNPIEERGTYCCSARTDVGHNQLMNDNGYFHMVGTPPVLEDPDTGCNCKYLGQFKLYPEGDFSEPASRQLTIFVLMHIYDSGLIYVELNCQKTGFVQTYSGYGAVGMGCEIVCYDKEEVVDPLHPLDPPTYTYIARQGPPYFWPTPGTTVVVAVGRSDFNLSIAINVPENSVACKNTCILSQRVTKGDEDAGFPLTGIRLSGLPDKDGRCPKIHNWAPDEFPNFPRQDKGSDCDGESECADPWKSPGWHCQEFNGYEPDGLIPPGIKTKKDCHGNARPSLYEYVTHKVTTWHNGPELPCSVDCCDLFVVYDYLGATFEDQSAWWHLTVDSSWKLDPRPECFRATRDGLDVYAIDVDCVKYYQAVPAIPLFLDPPTNLHKNPEWPWPTFELSAICGVTCQFYDNQHLGVDDELQPFLLVALPGERVLGVEEGHLLVVMSERTRQVQNTVPQDPLPPITYDLCVTETYRQICAINISPYAPDIQPTNYGCPDCHPGCYERDGVTLKAGADPVNHYYSEILYAATRAEVIDAAQTRAGVVKASEGAVIPYAHGMTSFGGNAADGGNSSCVPGGVQGGSGVGCCRGAWSTGDNGQYRWADAGPDIGHVTACEYGIKYHSTFKVVGGPHDGEWQTELIFCCQCQLGNIICFDGYQHHDQAYTDFFGVDATHVKLASESIMDNQGIPHYCRDFATAQTLATDYKNWSGTEHARSCWLWYAHNGFPNYGQTVTTGHWDNELDIIGVDSPTASGQDCSGALTNHDPVHYPKRASNAVGTFTTGNPFAYQIACRPDREITDPAVAWYWVGIYRECRYCDDPCSGSDCTPTLGGRFNMQRYGHTVAEIQSLSKYNTQTRWAIPARWFSDKWLTDCPYGTIGAAAAWVTQRAKVNYDGSDQGQSIPVPICGLSFAYQPYAGSSIAGCGTDYCVDKCGFYVWWYPTDGFEPWGSDRGWYNQHAWCNNSNSWYVGPLVFTVQDVLDWYAEAVTSCGENQYLESGWSVCGSENCGSACADPTVSTDAALYEIHTVSYWVNPGEDYEYLYSTSQFRPLGTGPGYNFPAFKQGIPGYVLSESYTYTNHPEYNYTYIQGDMIISASLCAKNNSWPAPSIDPPITGYVWLTTPI